MITPFEQISDLYANTCVSKQIEPTRNRSTRLNQPAFLVA